MNHKFPQTILSQINEHSGGAFILFRVDAQGEFQSYLQYDHAAIRTAVVSYAEQVVAEMRRVDKKAWSKALLRSLGTDEDESEDDSSILE